MQKKKVSLTAWVVAACHLALAGDKRWRALVDDESLSFYRQVDRYCRARFLTLRLLGMLPDAAKLQLVERALALGAPQHFALRKRAIRERWAECMKDGAAQMVVIGGGFDPLALQTARAHPHIACFECDMPGMHEHKLAIARMAYGTLPPNFHAIGADLSRAGLQELLAAHPAFDAGKPTLFIAEGITMYLSAEANRNLLRTLKALCEIPASFLFTAIELPRRADSVASGVREAVLASSNERFVWGLSPQEMPAFLAAQGFTQRSLTPYAELQRPWRDENELAALRRQSGEYLVYAVA